MNQEDFQSLLRRQKDISYEIQKLNNESLEINELLENYLLDTNKTNKQPSKREILESLGFTVSSKSIDGSQMFVIKKGSTKHTVLFNQSKYYNEPHHNAWYTFNPGVENSADFFILEYLTSTNKSVHLVIPKDIISQIAKHGTKFTDGRYNLKIQGDETTAISRDLNIDLTETINNFEVLNS